MPVQEVRCGNFNHGRANVTVRFCSMCGEIVNEKIVPQSCTDENHGIKRRQRSFYCVDCGTQLIAKR